MVFLLFEQNNQMYLSLVRGYLSAGKYCNVLILWTGVSTGFNHELIDALLYALVSMAMQVIEKAQWLNIFLDKWRHKKAFMENHKKLELAKLQETGSPDRVEELGCSYFKTLQPIMSFLS
jgi:hypothetical protein